MQSDYIFKFMCSYIHLIGYVSLSLSKQFVCMSYSFLESLKQEITITIVYKSIELPLSPQNITHTKVFLYTDSRIRGLY